MMRAYPAPPRPNHCVCAQREEGKTSGMTAAGDGIVQRMLRRADDVQRAHPTMAFPFAVIKKFGDDRASQLAALIAYYGFFSLFPLLLVFATVVAFVLKGNPDLQQRLIDSILEQFPVIGTEIGRVIDESVRQLSGSPLALTVGIVGALWTGTAVVAAAQRAMDDIWDVPRAERPGLLGRVVRAFLLFFVFGASIVLSTLLTETGTEGLGTPPPSRTLDRGTDPRVGCRVRLRVPGPDRCDDRVAPRAARRDLGGDRLDRAAAAGAMDRRRQIARASAVYGIFAIRDRPARVDLPRRAAVPAGGRGERRAGTPALAEVARPRVARHLKIARCSPARPRSSGPVRRSGSTSRSGTTRAGTGTDERAEARAVHLAGDLPSAAGSRVRLRASERAARPGRGDARADPVAGDPSRVGGRLDLSGRARPPAGGRHGRGGTAAVPVPRGLARPSRPRRSSIASFGWLGASPRCGGSATGTSPRAGLTRERVARGRRPAPRSRLLPGRVGGVHGGERLVRARDDPAQATCACPRRRGALRLRREGRPAPDPDDRGSGARPADGCARSDGRAAGRELLAFRDGTSWRDVRSEDINAYLKELAGEDISAKDFRTWHATVLTAALLASAGAGPHLGHLPQARGLDRRQGGGRGAREHAGGLPSVLHRPPGDRSVPERRDDRPAPRPGSHGRPGPRRRWNRGVLDLLDPDGRPHRAA